MKFLLAIIPFILFAFNSSAQTKAPQDTSVRKQESTQQNPPAKTSAPASKNQPETAPAVNRIAVSDPGMPPEKPATGSSNKKASTKPSERKKKSNAGANPK